MYNCLIYFDTLNFSDNDNNDDNDGPKSDVSNWFMSIVKPNCNVYMKLCSANCLDFKFRYEGNNFVRKEDENTAYWQ